MVEVSGARETSRHPGPAVFHGPPDQKTFAHGDQDQRTEMGHKMRLMDAIRDEPSTRAATCTRAHCHQPPHGQPEQADWAGLCSLHHNQVADAYNRLYE